MAKMTTFKIMEKYGSNLNSKIVGVDLLINPIKSVTAKYWEGFLGVEVEFDKNTITGSKKIWVSGGIEL